MYTDMERFVIALYRVWQVRDGRWRAEKADGSKRLVANFATREAVEREILAIHNLR